MDRTRHRLIGTEEAFSTSEHLEALSQLTRAMTYEPDLDVFRTLAGHPDLPGLLGLGGERLREMDQAEVDVQVLSLLSPGVQVFDADTATALAAATNDQLAEA